jgi:hypothetical protein
MRGIPREVTEHSLWINPGSKPIKHRLHHFDEEKQRAIREEISKLLTVGFVKEIHHSEWLANSVLVQKKSGKWRMCVDYTGFNKACPKDLFPLPRIDQVVDSTSDCEMLSFLDAYLSYYQIAMKESDLPATSFITHFDSYYYVIMSLDLKNAGQLIRDA